MSDYVTKTNVLNALGRFKENADDLYATDAELTDVKNALQANSKRITNLEQKAGDEIVVDYPSSTYGMDEVPPNVAEYAKVTKLKGVTRAWNQLMQNPTGSITDWKTISSFNAVSGHSYLFHMVFSRASTGQVTDWQIFLDGANERYGIDGQLAYRDVVYSFDNSGTTNVKCGFYSQYDSQNPVQYAIYVRDLTSIFPDLPSTDLVTSNIPNLVKRCPDILKYDAYGTSIVDTTVEGVKSVGVNIFNEVMELGTLGWADGQPQDSTTNMRSEYIPCEPNTTYHILSGAYGATLYEYTSSKATIQQIYNYSPNTSTSFTTSANAYYLRFRFQSGSTTYNHDVQICLDSSSTKATYHAWVEPSTLSLPTPVTLRSAGDVADTDELNVEVLVDGVKVSKRRQTVRINEADLGQCDWVYDYDYSVMRTDSLTDMSIADNWSALICAKYTVVNSNTPYVSMPDKSCKRQSITANFVIKDSDLAESDIVNNKIAKLLGTKLTYETATYSVTLLDPILDPFIKVEGGGTIETIQTQTPEIDSAMTAEYLSLGA